MTGAGIDPRDVLPWNAYPWFIDGQPTAAQLRAGVDPTLRLLELLPDLRVVLLLGRVSQQAWRILVATAPQIVSERGLLVLETFHPSRQALWHPDPRVRQDREAHLRATFGEAAREMKGAG